MDVNMFCCGSLILNYTNKPLFEEIHRDRNKHASQGHHDCNEEGGEEDQAATRAIIIQGFRNALSLHY